MDTIDRFTGKSDEYAKGRPGYAKEAVSYIYRTFVASHDPSIADIGAGTGKFTEQLARHGSTVWAVEPNPDMRARLATTAQPYGNTVHIIDGTAEDTHLRNASIDIVVAAQSFHWFDPAAFTRECERILRPDGAVLIVYNTALGRSAAHPQLAWWDEQRREVAVGECEITAEVGEVGLQADEPSCPAAAGKRAEANDAAYRLTLPSQRLLSRHAAIRDFFGGYVTRAEFPNPLTFDRDSYLAFMLSHSTTPRPDDEDYARYVASVQSIFDTDAVDDVLTLSYSTCVYSSSKV